MFTSIGRFTFHTFTLYLSMALLCSIAIALFRLRRTLPLRAVADAAVVAIVCGFALARAEYALLNADLFVGNVRGVFTMRPGGLDWHGALFGALFGVWIVAKLRRIDVSLLLDAFAPALPLLAFAGWTACRAVGCVYGEEVQTLALYPAWLVTEGRDIFGIIAPRYDTHTFGQGVAWVLLVMVAVFWLWDVPRQRPGVRFWLVLALFTAGMLAIGTVRGDYAPVVGLRADVWLDVAVLALATTGLL
ncbi:MAG: prolipoprotein diacylglyceryl transferase family protein, partial [Chloroflexota bacterium]